VKNKKTQDPTEAALSAIEDALNIGKDIPEVTSPAAERDPARGNETGTSEPASEVFAQRSRGTRERLPRSAANDDRQSVGQILQALHQKPSRTPIFAALLGSMAWVIGGALIAATQYRTASGAAMRISEITAQPSFLPTLAAILLPPLLFVMTAMLVRRSQEMRHISRAMTEVTLRLAEPEGVSADAIVSVGQTIRREVAALGDGIERAVARASELESMVRGEVATLERAYDENENRVRALIGELNNERDAIVEHSAHLRDAIAHAHEAFAFDVQNVADRVASALDSTTGRITENILMRAEDARAQLTEAGNTILDSLSERSAEATQRLTEVGIEIAKAIADRNDKVSEALQQSANDMHVRLGQRADEISRVIAQSGQTFENTIGQQLRTLADNVTTRGNDIANRIATDTSALNQTMTQSVQTFETTVRGHSSSVINEMKTAITGIAEASRDSLAALDQRVAAKIGEVSDDLDQRINRIETTLDARAKSLNETLATRTLEFSKTIAEGSKSATEAVEKSVAGMGEYFSTKSAEMAAMLSERAAKIDETLGTRALQMTETLDTRVNKFEELVVGRLESVTNSIEQKGLASADLLVERVSTVNDHLLGTAEQVERHLNELADGIAKNFVERVNNITGAHETLRVEVRDIIAELGQTHGLLQAAIDTASSTLGPIEGKVAEKVAAFHNTLENAINATRSTAERMDNQIRELNESSNGVLRDVSNLALRFEEQVRLVNTTSEALSQTHQRIDDGLARRRDAIDDVSNVLAERTTELEERLTRFNKMLEDTFAHAHGKAQDIARAVAESTATSTQSIARQYELIRNSSSEERERTNVALQDTYDEAMKTVNAMFSETNARFLEASRDLREISEDIQRTLDTTREEIRRTVFELPTETKESANAMRRVVADQIKALSELNEIVSRHGRHADQATVAYEYQGEVAAVGGRPAPRGALPRPQHDDGADLPPAPPARPREQAREPAPEPRRPAKSADRAARFDEALSKKARTAEPEAEDNATGIESLDSLSTDIASMIDHQAAAESWERFKRGERGVFNRRLYTNAGQKTFEEIRKKYRRNANFRETVDRYIDEFEKLLEQVSRDERGQTLTKTYLTSDTGKVYTLLAHAAGRLG
jgi:predicted RNA-binding protein YlqC (UPF0109 family)